jgi:hypothetical protein
MKNTSKHSKKGYRQNPNGNNGNNENNVKRGFERKMVGNEPNPKYVDMLSVDEPIAGQKYVCVSFCSPENILKKKEIFFFEQFLKKWDFNKSMEKFFQFLSFISYKYNISMEDINKDFQDFVKEERENLIKNSLDDDYKTFLDNNEEELQKMFDKEHEFQTNVRGIKIRGVYPTQEEAELRAKMLRDNDGQELLIGEVGLWLPWEPDAYKTGRVEYMEEELNQLMKEKMKNEANAKSEFEKRIKEAKQKAIEENIKNAEKSGNVLSQTIDENGNLVGVNNVNTQEFSLGEKENISSADICKELFEGENIVVGKTDYGQSELISGPFASRK